jgi:hypothetical protein
MKTQEKSKGGRLEEERNIKRQDRKESCVEEEEVREK